MFLCVSVWKPLVGSQQLHIHQSTTTHTVLKIIITTTFYYYSGSLLLLARQVTIMCIQLYTYLGNNNIIIALTRKTATFRS